MICSWCSKPLSPFKTHDNAKMSVFLSLIYSRSFGPFISTDLCQVKKQCLAHSRRSKILVEKVEKEQALFSGLRRTKLLGGTGGGLGIQCQGIEFYRSSVLL